MSNAYGAHLSGLFTIQILAHAQVTATQADEAITVCPHDCTVLYAQPVQGVSGGNLTSNILAFNVENGTTDIFNNTNKIKASSSGTIVTTLVTPKAAQANLSQGDVLHLDSTVTAGTSPTFDGAGVILVCARR